MASYPDPDQVDYLIRNRRSIFTDQFIPGKTIPHPIIWRLLENACWAPTHKRTEPWRFIVFTGPGLRRLADFQLQHIRNHHPGVVAPQKLDKLERTIFAASHVIAIGMKRSVDIDIPEVEEIAAVACAVQNIYLSAAAHGLSGYWSTGGVTYLLDANYFFGLDATDRLMGFFYLGYSDLPLRPGKRTPVQDQTAWIE